MSDIPRMMNEDELQAFLEDTSDLNDTLDLWDKTSGLPGLLNAVIRTEVRQQAYKPVETYFDVVEGVWRYVGSNRRVPSSRVRLGVMRISNASQIQMRELTVELVNGTITREQWYRSMATMMKNEYRAAYLAAIGGKANYTRSEISKFGWRMRSHYNWLNNFLDEIMSGKQPLNGRAVVRAGMYGRAANGIYQNELLRVAIEKGMREGKRILGENDNHCHTHGDTIGCIELVTRGWVPIDQLVPIGSATCRSNDLCHFIFRK